MTSTKIAPAAVAAVQLYPDKDVQPPVAPRATLNRAKLTLVAADLVVVAGALLAATLMSRRINPLDPTSTREYLGLALISLPVWPVLFTQQLLYRSRFLGRRVDEIARICRAVGLGMLVVVAIAAMLKFPLGRQWLVVTSFTLLTMLVSERMVARRIFRRARSNGSMLRPVLIVGRNAEGRLVRDMLDTDPSLGYRFDGFAEDLLHAEPGQSPLELLGDPSRIIDLIDRLEINSVIVATTAIDVGSSNRLIRALTEHGTHIELSSTLCDIASRRLTIRPVGRVPMMYIEPVRRDGWRARAKRAFDLSIAVPMFILTLPIVLGAMALVRLTSPGASMFIQQRVGRDGELFDIWKIRTMVNDAEDRLIDLRDQNETTGILFKVKEDPRITSVGKWLRKLSIDELPQLVNVIRGEMSLVGPRPALPSEAEQWNRELHGRTRVKPGITGMWQVDGRNEGMDHDATYAQLDLYYVDNWSLLTDLSILIRTVPVVVMHRGQH